MCIVVYKPKDKAMPKKDILRECFDSNRDGAGYMYPTNNMVQIKKGFMTFDSFYDSLMKDYKDKGKKTPFVLHFRIGTQGGNVKSNTHPFPISKNMADLRLTDCLANFGIAHNGIISLTTTYGERVTEYDYLNKQYVTRYKSPDYSDTMKFITDYLALMIKDNNWYKDDNTIELIEKLVGVSNKFAIMDGEGHTTLIGSFIEDNGIYYSNNTYQTYDYCYAGAKRPNNGTTLDDYDYYYDDYYERYYNEITGEYDFPKYDCPPYQLGTDDYCEFCSHYKECYNIVEGQESLLDDEDVDRLANKSKEELSNNNIIKMKAN